MKIVCKHLDAGEHWRTGQAGSSFSLASPNFNVTIKVASKGDIIEDSDSICEEVSAILEGTFYVEAEDEAYELSAGEGIVVPPGKDRAWRCTSNRGVLYRVLVTQLVKIAV